MGIGNRKEIRKPVGIPGRIVLSEGAPIECTLQDISQGGAKLSVLDLRAIPDTFVLLLSSSGSVRRNCKVVRRAMGEVGVQFV
jgi:hypothetical protein